MGKFWAKRFSSAKAFLSPENIDLGLPIAAEKRIPQWDNGGEPLTARSRDRVTNLLRGLADRHTAESPYLWKHGYDFATACLHYYKGIPGEDGKTRALELAQGLMNGGGLKAGEVNHLAAALRRLALYEAGEARRKSGQQWISQQKTASEIPLRG